MLEIRQGEDCWCNEVELCERLNIGKPVLDNLRLAKDFPYYRLTTKDRLYRTSEVVGWLEKRGKVN